MFKLALVQLRVEGGAPERNLARAEERIAAAAAAGAKVVLLPETLNLGWTHPLARSWEDAVPGGPTCGRLAAAARRHGVYVCAGLVESAGPLRHNAAVLLDPSGALLLHHRKVHELPLAHDLYAPADRIAVARTPLGVFGVMICADAFAPGQGVSRALALLGAEVILSPCAWAMPPDHDQTRQPYGWRWLESYCPVAREHGIWIAGCSSVGPIQAGPWAGRRCIGSSLVVDPQGDPVLQGPYGEDAEALLLLDIAPRPRPRTGSE